MIVKATKSDSGDLILDVLGVPYGGPENGRDIDGDYFSRNTKLHEDKYALPQVVVLHTTERMPNGKVKLADTVEYIGKALSYEDKQDGRWYSLLLDKTKESARRMWEHAKAGAVKVSSGTAGHLARVDKFTGHIKEWPVFEISLVSALDGERPSNGYAVAIPRLKALGIEIEPQTKGDTAKGAEASPEATGAALNEVNNREVKQMSEQNDNTQAAPAFDMEAFGDIVGKAVKAQVEPIRARLAKLEEEDARPVNDPGFAVKSKSAPVVVEDEADKYVKNHPNKLGFFMHAVKAHRVNYGGMTNNMKAILGQNESVPTEGGFLVGTEQSGELIKKMHESAVFSSRAQLRTIAAGSNSADFYGVSENSRANGSRFGGVRGYRVAEGQTITASDMKFYKFTLKPNKYAAVVYETNELANDTRLMEQEIMASVPMELAFMLDDDMLNGTSAGYAKGILDSASLVEVPKVTGQAAATIEAQNIIDMWARLYPSSESNAVWFINKNVTTELHALNLPVGTGGALVYMPPGGLSGSPYGTLYGRPVVPTEFNATLGTVGDIVLADWSQYKLATVGGLNSSSSIHIQFLTDQTAFKFTTRYDGQSMWESSLTPYKSTDTQSPFIALATRA